MNIDAERVNRLTMDGYLVLQFTYDTVVNRPDYVVRSILEALVLGAQRSA
jgi:very-short-patch-repair endonuclease